MQFERYTGADLSCAIDTSIRRSSVTICSALNLFFGMTYRRCDDATTVAVSALIWKIKRYDCILLQFTFCDSD
jgi:hypothetical protein